MWHDVIDVNSNRHNALHLALNTQWLIAQHL